MADVEESVKVLAAGSSKLLVRKRRHAGANGRDWLTYTIQCLDNA